MLKATAVRKEKPVKFEPVELKIVFDNQDDLDAFYAIMCHTKIIGIFNDDNTGERIRCPLDEFEKNYQGKFRDIKNNLKRRY